MLKITESLKRLYSYTRNKQANGADLGEFLQNALENVLEKPT